MTLGFLYVIRDYNIHLQGHQYQIIQFIEKKLSMHILDQWKIQHHWLNQYKIQNQNGSSNSNN